MVSLSVQKTFAILMLLNVAVMFTYYSYFAKDESILDLHRRSQQSLHTQSDSAAPELITSQHKLEQIDALLRGTQQEIRKLYKATDKEQRKNTPKRAVPKTPFAPLVNPNVVNPQFTREENPFHALGAYPKFSVAVPYEDKVEKTHYDEPNYGLTNEDDYCDRVDYYNLANPENVFENRMFFTDYGHKTVPWKIVIPKLGTNLMPLFSKYTNKKKFDEEDFNLDIRINSFFVNMDGFHKYHAIGKNFLCATQMFNHIPGHRAMIRKDDLVESVNLYAEKFKHKPQCFNKHTAFPHALKLDKEEECKEFFDKINTQKYKDSLKSEPIQFLIKVGHGTHSGDGVFLLDQARTESMNVEYDYGKKCGEIQDSLMAQSYVSNPLLLDMHNKFDFRIFMLIASTNPFMVYYGDGIIRASLSEYDKFSTDRRKHLTNSHIAASLFSDPNAGRINGMTADQLKDYHLWSMEELEDYLLETGKITNVNWLAEYLRPQFKKAMIHLVRMSKQFFWKQSNVYGLFGLDFMLDENMNVWFIECNPNPSLFPVNTQFRDLIKIMLRDEMEIAFGLYRSRMKRVFTLFERIKKEAKEGNFNGYERWVDAFKEANANRFEPEYLPSTTNTFDLILDENLKGEDVYQGLLEPECVDP